MPFHSEVTKLKHRVLVELVKMTAAGSLATEIKKILETVVTENGPRYRCCVYKERAVLKDRLKAALSQPLDMDLELAAQRALEGIVDDSDIVRVMPLACDQCPIDKFLVTNACRNCLAHNCINSCPRDAIMVAQNRAYIDKDKCVECGLCKRSCNYGAIIEVSRPCENVCSLGAITAGRDRKARIDDKKCVQCGSCKVACPFGAIEESSVLVQILQAIKSEKRVYALLAPAFVGQFGPKVQPGQVFGALKKAGFYAVEEVAFGADLVSAEESKEFLESVPSKRSFMTTSCCPAFVTMVEKHLPELKNHVSNVVSPMIALGRLIKEQDPEAKVLFIGPCIAKKGEIKRYPGAVDYVATFEEIFCFLEGIGIQTETVETVSYERRASKCGVDFAVAGGAATAIGAYLGGQVAASSFLPYHANGLQHCKDALTMLCDGKIGANFFEGMACEKGCVGGPGVLMDAKVAAKFVALYARKAAYASAKENQKALKQAQNLIQWHVEN